jgi:hypothetical protein
LLVAALASIAIVVSAVIIRTEEQSPPLRFPAADYRGYPDVPLAGLLVGTNYTHYAFPNCSWNGTNILRTYARDAVRRRVHVQLRTMRRRGIESLRLVVWHITDPRPNRWGPVPSAGGRISDPYRTNLIEYLQEVRRFGFGRLTVSFGPQWTNNPLADNYDGSKFSENWRFVKDVRSLVKRYGPRDTRIDLFNEGAPSDYLKPRLFHRMNDYVSSMYARYVRAFGSDDVTVSVIGPENRFDRGNRLQNLIDSIRSTGLPQPRWFEIHLNDAPADALQGLRSTDQVLRRNGLDQPIVIGETFYDDPSLARAFREFFRSSRRVEEIIQWFRRRSSSCNLSPPYAADAYLPLSRVTRKPLR